MDYTKQTKSAEEEEDVEACESGATFTADFREDSSKEEDKGSVIEIADSSDADSADPRDRLTGGDVEDPPPMPPGGLRRQNYVDALAGVPGAHPVGNPMQGEQAVQRMNPEETEEFETTTSGGDEAQPQISSHLVNDTDDDQAPF
jgi:hypothetical protein